MRATQNDIFVPHFPKRVSEDGADPNSCFSPSLRGKRERITSDYQAAHQGFLASAMLQGKRPLG